MYWRANVKVIPSLLEFKFWDRKWIEQKPLRLVNLCAVGRKSFPADTDAGDPMPLGPCVCRHLCSLGAEAMFASLLSLQEGSESI